MEQEEGVATVGPPISAPPSHALPHEARERVLVQHGGRRRVPGGRAPPLPPLRPQHVHEQRRERALRILRSLAGGSARLPPLGDVRADRACGEALPVLPGAGHEADEEAAREGQARLAPLGRRRGAARQQLTLQEPV